MMKSSGVDVIASDILVGTVLTFGCFFVAFTAAGISYLWGYLVFKSSWEEQMMAPVIFVSVLCGLAGKLYRCICIVFIP